MAKVQASEELEFCPSCGDLVSPEDFDYVTGWCIECSPAVERQLESYLTLHADAIEFYISEGKSFWQALKALSDSKNGYIPNCVVCGKPMRHAPRTSVFCRKTGECKRMSRRYVYLYTERGLTKAEALAQILEELTG